MNVFFINFNQQDLDTILLVKYEPGNTFTSKIDSVYVDPMASVGLSKDTLYGYFEHIQLDKDYEIILPSINRTFRISDIKTRRQKCPCAGGHYRTISAYRLQQGDIIYGENVEIAK